MVISPFSQLNTELSASPLAMKPQESTEWNYFCSLRSSALMTPLPLFIRTVTYSFTGLVTLKKKRKKKQTTKKSLPPLCTMPGLYLQELPHQESLPPYHHNWE